MTQLKKLLELFDGIRLKASALLIACAQGGNLVPLRFFEVLHIGDSVEHGMEYELGFEMWDYIFYGGCTNNRDMARHVNGCLSENALSAMLPIIIFENLSLISEEVAELT